MLEKLGLDVGDSAGLSIIAWTFMLKILSTPYYENAIKHPAEFTMAV